MRSIARSAAGGWRSSLWRPNRNRAARSGWRRIEQGTGELGEQQSGLNGPVAERRRAPSMPSPASRKRSRQVQLQVGQGKRSRPQPGRQAWSTGTLATSKQELAAKGRPSTAETGEKNLLQSEEVTQDDIAEVIAKWTGIPVAAWCRAKWRKLAASRSGGCAQPGDRQQQAGHGRWQMRFSAPAPGYQIRIGPIASFLFPWNPRGRGPIRKLWQSPGRPDVDQRRRHCAQST